MENYIVINGKKAELTKDQLEKLGIKPKMSKYEEMFNPSEEKYYKIQDSGVVAHVNAHNTVGEYNNILYAVGNYCKDENVMKQRALHETLNRLLWRASVIAGELDNPWDGFRRHHSIYRGVDGRFFLNTASNSCKYHNEIYFPTQESAKDAIENIIEPFMKEHPDFVW